ncbi:hypothetical protein DYB37_005969 [Aphanomyces astaci]|uniref:Nucleosome assembly protein n=1 Tax=Aphanomyces astaci TaxID=112090 RepID=A0A3R7BEX7_APHAT|nr:hypothetical protein DYB35_000032 [Aphanomyces astaci]RHZ26831.1 hypothetical protein DYB37_005969 [Aphanomyces astaci]
MAKFSLSLDATIGTVMALATFLSTNPLGTSPPTTMRAIQRTLVMSVVFDAWTRRNMDVMLRLPDKCLVHDFFRVLLWSLHSVVVPQLESNVVKQWVRLTTTVSNDISETTLATWEMVQTFFRHAASDPTCAEDVMLSFGWRTRHIPTTLRQFQVLHKMHEDVLQGFDLMTDAVATKLNELVIDADVGDEGEDITLDLPAAVLTRVNHLKTLQEQHGVLEAEFEKERRLLELKYEKLYQPLYSERALVVSGDKEVATAEDKAAETEETKTVGIPQFWMKAFLNHPETEQLITDRDMPALEFLKDVKSESSTENNGFRLEFTFAPNPFFENTVLTKAYDVAEGPDGDALLKNIQGTEIKWLEGKNLTEKKKKIKQKAKNGGQTRFITKVEPCDSFFQLFSTVDIPAEDDEEENEDVMRQLDADFQIGFTIHETIVPQAVLWFTGEAQLDDSDYEDDDDDEYDDEEEDEDSDDDDAPRKKGGKKPFPALEGAAGADSTEKPPECKNQ